MTEKRLAFTMEEDKYEKPVGMFFSCRKGGEAVGLPGPCGLLLRARAGPRSGSGHCGGPPQHEKIWRCNKTQ